MKVHKLQLETETCFTNIASQQVFSFAKSVRENPEEKPLGFGHGTAALCDPQCDVSAICTVHFRHRDIHLDEYV